MKHNDDLKEQYKNETRETAECIIQRYAGDTPHADGYTDEYVEWLENKLSEHRNADDMREVNLPIKCVSGMLLEEKYTKLKNDYSIIQKQYDKRGRIMQNWIKKFKLPIDNAVLD